MKAAFYTLGCKVNQCETEYITELFKKNGYEIVNYTEKSDIYVINSCTVTATADQKTRQSIRKFKRNHPESIVILTGCMPQAYESNAAELSEADIVISNKENSKIIDYLNQYLSSCQRLVHIDKHSSGEKFDECKITSFGKRIRAFVKIEDGCDRFCSYCIIPISRGRVRSKPLNDLKDEVKSLAENGIKEIVLVGINLSSYGKGENFNIVDAVKICAETDGIERVRLGSLEPDHITDEIIENLSEIEKFCPQFHISLQSGCDKTLKSMNRHYTSAEYRELCEKLRKTFSDCSLTTDVVTGFCGETEEDFNDSLNFVKSISFEKVHVFPYSERPGTAASKLGKDLPKQLKEQRANILIKENDKIRENYFRSLTGETKEVLFENFVDGYNIGYTKNYVPVKVKGEENLISKTKKVRITDFSGCDFCFGEIVL